MHGIAILIPKEEAIEACGGFRPYYPGAFRGSSAFDARYYIEKHPEGSVCPKNYIIYCHCRFLSVKGHEGKLKRRI